MKNNATNTVYKEFFTGRTFYGDQIKEVYRDMREDRDDFPAFDSWLADMIRLGAIKKMSRFQF